MNPRLKAPLIAIGYIALVYISIIHLFVLWKWQTSPEIDELFMQVDYDDSIKIDDVDMPTIPGVPQQAAIDALKVESNLLQQQQESSPQKEEASKTIASYFSKLMDWDNDKRLGSSELLLSQGSEPMQDLQISNLLLKSSLAEILEEWNLQSTMDAVLKELEGLGERRLHVQWDLIHTALMDNSTSNPFPVKEKLTEQDLIQHMCSAAANDQNQNNNEEDDDAATELAENQDLALYVHEDDFEGYLQELNQLLHQRESHLIQYFEKLDDSTFVTKTMKELSRDLQEDLKESKALIHSEIEGLVARLRSSTAFATDSTPGATDMGHCIPQEHVLALVEEGLSALQRHGDLRMALLETLKEIDPNSADNLILDAVLETRSPIPELKPTQTINVRRLLDTPLLKYSVGGMDWFSDWIRTYTDQVDEYVDKMAVKSGVTMRKGGASNGEIVVTRLLQITGRIQVPVPAPAQQLLTRTKLA